MIRYCPDCGAKTAVQLVGTHELDVHPILVVGMVADGVIGSVVVWIVGSARCVGVPPDPHACKRCSYSLVGLDTSVCPECGAKMSEPVGQTESTADGATATRGAPR